MMLKLKLIQPKKKTNIKVHLLSKFQIHKKVSYNDKSEKSQQQKNPDKSSFKKKWQWMHPTWEYIKREEIEHELGEPVNLPNWLSWL